MLCVQTLILRMISIPIFVIFVVASLMGHFVRFQTVARTTSAREKLKWFGMH